MGESTLTKLFPLFHIPSASLSSASSLSARFTFRLSIYRRFTFRLFCFRLLKMHV
jgi:hypothetical protein